MPSKKRKKPSPAKPSPSTDVSSNIMEVTCPQGDPYAIEGPSVLPLLLHPLPPQTFLRDAFLQKCLYLKQTKGANRTHLLKTELFSLNPKELFEETSSDSVFVWLNNRASIRSIETDP